MQSAATTTPDRPRLRRQININVQEKLEKVWILQEGVAHFGVLLSWKTRDSPKGFVCSSSLRGIFSEPSRYLTGSAEKNIGIGDPTQSPQEPPSFWEWRMSTCLSRFPGGAYTLHQTWMKHTELWCLAVWCTGWHLEPFAAVWQINCVMETEFCRVA